VKHCGSRGVTLLARKWESALLVNVDNKTLQRILDNPEAMAAVERIEGWRSLGDNIIETIINESDKVSRAERKALPRAIASTRWRGQPPSPAEPESRSFSQYPGGRICL
jgi:hypothetical protein